MKKALRDANTSRWL